MEKLCQKKKLIHKKKFGGMFIKKTMKYVKDCKREDLHLFLKKEVSYLHTGKKVSKRFKNL